MSGRTANCRDDEDVILCQAYMEVSQDPITGISQTSKRFWARVTAIFNKSKNPSYADRGQRSLQCRYSDIEAGVKRLLHSIKHVESQNPSWASEETIVNNQSPNCGTPNSTGFSQFSVDLNDDDDNVGGSSSQRPIGVKKAKLKIKVEEERSKDLDKLKAQNEEVVELMKKAAEDRKHHFEMREKELYLKEQEMLLRAQKVQMHQQQIEMHKKNKEVAREDKILARDLSSISDETVRAHLQAEQIKIIQKRAQQNQYLCWMLF
ncbi:hypothetical protein BUALT_Bualt01G0082300 [Buddleja alternifolia]|uniref:No apical meristem-associated C-terminal domain-containing protein n=1 Tax=Buddleja alternifolia TaxID=168488 RepID=A0AAV6YFX4_9LAMI|nr:hypothetical protein BUALT_Bualt01G0082300 [Buddleja alternifolia]